MCPSVQDLDFVAVHYYPMTTKTTLLATLLGFGLSMLPATEIVAHRGASADAPENTLASFNLAWEQKADAIELDIYLTSDGKIICIHDKDTLRTTGKNLLVAGSTLAQLQALDAGTWKDARWKEERMPTLAEAIATIPAGKRVFIEIKTDEKLIPELQRVITASGRPVEQFVIISFNYEALEMARPVFPNIPLLWIIGAKKDKVTGKKSYPPLDPLVEKARTARLDGLDLHYEFPLDAAAVAKVKGAGLKLAVWTVDDPAAAKKLAALGVEAITTDKPAFLRERLGLPESSAPVAPQGK